MPTARTPRPTEAGFTRTVLEYARLQGWRTSHFRPALTRGGRWVTPVQGDGKGFPDLVLVRGRVVFAELKVPPNRLTPDQAAWVAALRGGGAEVHVWTPDSWPEIEAVLGGKGQMLMCPHCGWQYEPAEFGRPGDDGRPFALVPPHTPSDRLSVIYVEPIARCPGSEQHPRNPESDRRPLWKDGGVR